VVCKVPAMVEKQPFVRCWAVQRQRQ